MDFRRKRKTSVDIGLIPMIDVLLVLLFFFMLATTFRQHNDIKINLPKAEGTEIQETTRAINLFIDAKGGYTLTDENENSRNVPNHNLDGLQAVLTQLEPTVRQLPFIINADGQTPHQAVISAMDIANQIGFRHLTFAISPPEKK